MHPVTSKTARFHFVSQVLLCHSSIVFNLGSLFLQKILSDAAAYVSYATVAGSTVAGLLLTLIAFKNLRKVSLFLIPGKNEVTGNDTPFMNYISFFRVIV